MAEENCSTHKVGEATCSRCAHACAVSVERSYTYVRCGNQASANGGKWSEAWMDGSCPDFVPATEDQKKAYEDAWHRSGQIAIAKIYQSMRRRMPDEKASVTQPTIPPDVDPERYRAYVPVEKIGS